MKRVCAYCKRVYGNSLKAAPSLPPGSISHGICKDCLPRAEAEFDALILANRSQKAKSVKYKTEKGQKNHEKNNILR